MRWKCIEYYLENTNKLLGTIPGLRGLKTGWTENAGECLVSWVKRDNGEILTVILGSSDRFGESNRLINWVYDNFVWIPIESKYQLLPEHKQ